MRTVSYNDAALGASPSQLGYGDGDEATRLGYGSDPNNKYVTTYFRKSFIGEDPYHFQALTLNMVRR
jgi:hypothetical protein